jgi:hypothetical protein
MQHATVVEHEELVLAATLDRTHRRSAQRSLSGRRHATPQRLVQHVDATDRLPYRHGSHAANGAFDFG